VPHYFFHTHDGREEALDLQGLDLPDLATAQHEAANSVREWLAIGPGQPTPGAHVEVVEGYAPIPSAIVPFAEALAQLR
jgi:hypothetical protein